MVTNRHRTLPILIAVALILAGCDKAAEIIPGGQERPRVTEASFELGEVRAVDPQDRPDSGQKAQDEAAKAVALINGFYSSAFLDPAKWQGGQHPDLAPLFTAEAQPGLAGNLNNLAMSDLSDKIESVEPRKQRLEKISFFVEPDGSLPVGVASVVFEATGTPSGGGEDVAITHVAHYWLQREGDAYKISAFQTAVAAIQEGQ